MEELIQALVTSSFDLEGLNHAPIQVWEAHPIISQYLSLSDRKIAEAIDKALEIRGSEATETPQGYSLDLSNNAAFGYALGDRNWLGLAIVPSHRETTFVVCRITYEDKDLAKSQGAKWDKKFGWYWEVADMQAACAQIKKIIAAHDLADKIAHKGEIAVYCTKKSEFERQWCAQVAGGSIPKAVSAPKTETLEDIVISCQVAEDLQNSAKYFCGIAESEDGIEGFAIKAPFQFKEQIKWIASYGGGNAKWLADKKLWLIPLKCAATLEEGDRHHATAIKFFEGFTFSPKAKPYFEAAIAAGLI